ncbi:MAG TPA: tRNA 2-selenouridine(34) synthase MnmH [Leucothrix sp.]|nr:tRNA 2-selenouridine(34) synthase MnmH [Leucothrix sp.]
MTDLKLKGLPKGEHPQIDDLAGLFINDVPLLDVRAPVEFEQGAFPNAVNIPLMTDKEREAVGIRYKEQGQDAAILLGSQLVTEEEQSRRKKQWAAFFDNNEKLVKTGGGGYLYCFRGGLRSQISQQWILDETGKDYPRVKGGYKAMRRFLIESTERIVKKIPIVILGGRTGSGKTRLLKKLDNSIDLEGLANHRGSAFGSTATSQPTQINFENALAIELLKKEAAGVKFLIIEDEASNVGSLGVPQALFEAMQQSPIVRLEVAQCDRNKISIKEYVVDTQAHFAEVYGKQQGEIKLSEHLLNSLEKIQKRLGGVRYQEAKKQMTLAIEARLKTGSLDGFAPVVNTLLVDYYDPMYDYQIEKKKERIIFQGDFKEVLNYLNDYKLAQ